MHFDKEINTLGLRCPEPIMLVRKAIREMQHGQILRVIADDPASLRDIPKFCLYMNHQLLDSTTQNNHFHFLIKKCN